MLPLIIAVAPLLGCAPRFAIRQASFDHRCGEEQIQVVRSSEDGRTVEMNVCGTLRRYQAIGGRKPATWVDVTTGFPAGEKPSPAP